MKKTIEKEIRNVDKGERILWRGMDGALRKGEVRSDWRVEGDRVSLLITQKKQKIGQRVKFAGIDTTVQVIK